MQTAQKLSTETKKSVDNLPFLRAEPGAEAEGLYLVRLWEQQLKTSLTLDLWKTQT